MAWLVRLEMILNEHDFNLQLWSFLNVFCPPLSSCTRRLGDFQRPSLNTRCRFLGGIWGTWSEGSAVRRAPACRRSRRWGTGPNLPRRKTLTSRNRDWCRLGGRICSEGNGTAQSWCLLHRCTRKWCKMCLKKRKTIIRIFIQLKFHTFTVLILSSSSVERSTLEINHTYSGLCAK